MSDAQTAILVVVSCFLPVYFLAYFVLNDRWDRARVRAEVEACGGHVLRIIRAPDDAFSRSAREYWVKLETADGAHRNRVAVTAFWMGVAWRDPPRAPATSVPPPRDERHGNGA